MPIDNSGDLDPYSISDETLSQLPDDLQAAIIAARIERQKLIDVLGQSVAKKRDEAIKHRSSSGIEQIWTEDEEFYEGLDDANRDENKLLKPPHPSGVVTAKLSKRKAKGSTVFMNITRQYVNNAAASVSELGNPTDDRNFSLKPAPDKIMDAHEDNQTPHPATNQIGQPVQATVADFAAQSKADAEKKAKAAQEQIDTWLLACQWHAQMRECVLDSAKIGSGVLKGPFPAVFKGTKSVTGPDGKLGMQESIETVPASKRIDIWNLFPAADCGDDIQKGSHLLERDFVNARTLRDMKMLPGYLSAQIDSVLMAGPLKNQNVKRNRTDQSVAEDNEEYEIWYYYGLLTRDEIDAMGVTDSLKNSEDASDQKALRSITELQGCPCIVTMANDVPIRASLNPLSNGAYPYDIMPWEKMANSPWGKGVSRIMRTAQRITTAALRNLMDNAGLSGGVQVGVKKGSIRPMGGNWSLSNITIWELTDDDARSINDCLSFHQIPSLQRELLEIIQFGQKMAEDVTGMPLLQQGQQGSAPDTVGGMQLLNKNANATRRMKARAVDDELTTPHIRRYYQWIMDNTDDDNMKGDFIIDAHGSQSLVEKDVARQFATQMSQNALQPAFGIDPYKAMSNMLRAEMIDPTSWQMDEKTYQANMQKQAQAGSPIIQAAQIRVASAEKIAQEQIAADQQVAQIRASATVQAVQTRTARDDQFSRDKLEADSTIQNQELAIKQQELVVTERIAMLNYATQQKISLQDARSQLAQTTMKLQTEKELSAAQQQMDAAIHVSDKVSADHAQQQAISAQSGSAAHQDIATMAGQHHDQTMQTAKQQHEANMELMGQRHAREIQDAEHQHAIRLQPAVQVPGRAANGHALDQTNPVEQ